MNKSFKETLLLAHTYLTHTIDLDTESVNRMFNDANIRSVHPLDCAFDDCIKEYIDGIKDVFPTLDEFDRVREIVHSRIRNNKNIYDTIIDNDTFDDVRDESVRKFLVALLISHKALTLLKMKGSLSFISNKEINDLYLFAKELIKYKLSENLDSTKNLEEVLLYLEDYINYYICKIIN